MLNLKVTIDSNSGFCFGVVYAIDMAESILDETGKLYCLGDIVHNDEEVERLKKKGLVTISHDDLPGLKGEKVLIRAHGEPPETYKMAMENDIELIDASCPVVLKLQHRVMQSSIQHDIPIYIYGKHGHAEVKGLIGQTNGDAVVFQDIKELDNVTLPPELILYSQTTKDTRNLYSIKSSLESRGVKVHFNDTICRQVSNRDLQLREFVKQFHTIIFVSGTKSSNGKVLYGVCKEYNPDSYFISSSHELDRSWFNEGDSVGICGATSTPLWLMEEVKVELESL